MYISRMGVAVCARVPTCRAENVFCRILVSSKNFCFTPCSAWWITLARFAPFSKDSPFPSIHLLSKNKPGVPRRVNCMINICPFFLSWHGLLMKYYKFILINSVSLLLCPHTHRRRKCRWRLNKFLEWSEIFTVWLQRTLITI